MEENQKEKILEHAEELFMRLGIRSVTMDDVARELAISKKTLYQHFENKDGLVEEVTRSHMDREKHEFENIPEKSSNAIEEMYHIASCMRDNFTKINPSVLFDLEKFHEKAWNVYLEFKNKFIFNQVKDNLLRGIREGYYREEINVDILSIFRVNQVQMIFHPRIYPPDKFDFAEVQIQLFDHFVHGLLTPKGMQVYDTYHHDIVKSI